jgi:hypothetical protein
MFDVLRSHLASERSENHHSKLNALMSTAFCRIHIWVTNFKKVEVGDTQTNIQ